MDRCVICNTLRHQEMITDLTGINDVRNFANEIKQTEIRYYFTAKALLKQTQRETLATIIHCFDPQNFSKYDAYRSPTHHWIKHWMTPPITHPISDRIIAFAAAEMVITTTNHHIIQWHAEKEMINDKIMDIFNWMKKDHERNVKLLARIYKCLLHQTQLDVATYIIRDAVKVQEDHSILLLMGNTYVLHGEIDTDELSNSLRKSANQLLNWLGLPTYFH